MASTEKQACRKKEYQKVSFDRKLSIIDEIQNGLISINHVSEVYNISRSKISSFLFHHRFLLSYLELGWIKNEEKIDKPPRLKNNKKNYLGCWQNILK